MLARAARDNNKLAENAGLASVLNDLGMTEKDAVYIAHQRALRAYLVYTGRHGDALASDRVMFATEIPAKDKPLFAALFGAFMDGLVTGVRAEQDRPKGL